jgi:hypothetical protein
MEEKLKYREDLLDWCNNLYSYWNSMKPKVANHVDMERLGEWEGSCRQLQEKLQANLNVDFDDYLTAKSLYEHWEQIFRESNAYQEETEVGSDNRLVWEVRTQINEELVETDAYQEESEVDSDNRWEVEEQTQIQGELLATNDLQREFEVETDKSIDLEEQLQYREGLLERFNNIDYHWESMRPSFAKLFESLVEWEVSYRHLKDKLQADLKADFDDYRKVKSLLNNDNSYSNNRMHIKRR